MRKIICGIAIVFGIAIIGTGIFLQLNSEKEIEKGKTSTEEVKFQRINDLNLEETCSTYKLIETFINTSDYTKISFNYPDCVHEYNLSFWNKMLKNEDDTISIDIKKDKETITNYMNKKKTSIISLKNDTYNKNVTYTEILKTKTPDGREVAILECNYQYSIFTTMSYDIWYIAVEINDDLILTYEIKVKDKILSYDVVEDLYNNIKIEPETATFRNSTIEGDYQIGSLKQNIKDSYQNGYKLNYKISTKYPEVDSFGSNYDESTFEFEELSNNFYANIALLKDSYYDTIEEKAQMKKEIGLKTYNEDTVRYRNTSDTGLIRKNINGKEVYYFIYKYDYYIDNKFASTGYYCEVLYEIAKDFYYSVYLSTKNIEVNEAVISEFLNFTIEEY